MSLPKNYLTPQTVRASLWRFLATHGICPGANLTKAYQICKDKCTMAKYKTGNRNNGYFLKENFEEVQATLINDFPITTIETCKTCPKYKQGCNGKTD